MKIFFIVFCVFLCCINGLELEEGSICAGKKATSKPVLDFCTPSIGEIKHRCCLGLDNTTFVAIDLTEANLTAIPDFTQHVNFNLSVIDLRTNPDLVISPEQDFLTLINLNDLILPNTTECPGGNRTWETIEFIDDPPGIRCRTQKDVCANSTGASSRKGSLCSANGPDHCLCLCKSGYHDYKCLRYGKFPMAAFFGSTIAVTIAASAILYWTQRRHVKK